MICSISKHHLIILPNSTEVCSYVLENIFLSGRRSKKLEIILMNNSEFVVCQREPFKNVSAVHTHTHIHTHTHRDFLYLPSTTSFIFCNRIKTPAVYFWSPERYLSPNLFPHLSVRVWCSSLSQWTSNRQKMSYSKWLISCSGWGPGLHLQTNAHTQSGLIEWGKVFSQTAGDNIALG